MKTPKVKKQIILTGSYQDRENKRTFASTLAKLKCELDKESKFGFLSTSKIDKTFISILTQSTPDKNIVAVYSEEKENFKSR